MKKGSIIKHHSAMDVCYKIEKVLKTNDRYHMKVKIMNMGFVQSYIIEEKFFLKIAIDDIVNWKMAWKPVKCLRYASWINCGL